jgi:hypothetical protein
MSRPDEHLRGGALGQGAVVLQAVTHIAPAIAILFSIEGQAGSGRSARRQAIADAVPPRRLSAGPRDETGRNPVG